MDLSEACRFKRGSDSTSWELMPTGHSKLTLLVEPQRKTPKSYTTPEPLPSLLAVPRQSHDPLGVD